MLAGGHGDLQRALAAIGAWGARWRFSFGIGPDKIIVLIVVGCRLSPGCSPNAVTAWTQRCMLPTLNRRASAATQIEVAAVPSLRMFARGHPSLFAQPSVGRVCLPLISSHILSYPRTSSHILAYPLISSHILSYPPTSSHILAYPLISSHIPSYPLISSHILPYPLISSHILSYPLISSHILSYPLMFVSGRWHVARTIPSRMDAQPHMFVWC